LILERQSLPIGRNWVEVRVVQALARTFKHGRGDVCPD
jgi:hypothetical protein